MDPKPEVIIVGAGVAGLTCARRLQRAGRSVLVLERSRRPGGRLSSKPATPGTPDLDFGPVFLHGDDPEFLADLGDPGSLEGWPQVVRGRGLPCQPEALQPGQTRFGIAAGLGEVSRRWARDISWLPEVEVVSIQATSEGFAVTSAQGQTWKARDLVLALAVEQTLALLQTLSDPGSEGRSALALLRQISSLPSLAVLARYPATVPTPDWHIWYPEDSPAVLLISNEGTKRADPNGRVSLVVQSRPGWARSRLEADRDTWVRDLLSEAARLVGPWAAQPEETLAHRWKYGRLGPSDRLASPMVLTSEGWGGRLGLAGDLFDGAGGVQGAWRSGRRLADRLAFG